MDFENNKAIYEQMADRLCDEIIAGTSKADDRIPSVREYAVMLQVNTTFKRGNHLQQTWTWLLCCSQCT